MDRKTETHTYRLHRIGLPALLGALFVFAAPGSALADSLDFKSTPLSEAAARIGGAFHVKLDLSRGIDPRRSVTFSVLHTEQNGALLEAVNSLANAIGADYRKEFVLSPAPAGLPPAAQVIDAATAPVSFDNETVPAAQAITIVAGVDQASVQVPASVQGTVTFSSKNLTVQDAMRQIAIQTRTQWNVAYTLTPHADGASQSGRVIGHTASGQPIIEIVGVTFRKATDPAKSDGPTPEDLKDPVFLSAMRRGDRSAMLKFHHDPPSTPPSTGGK